MMRLYTFFLITTLLLTPYVVCAGTDDTGLQVFTINGGELLGETSDVGQEDTKISQYSYNLFNSGNGLCSLPQPYGSGYEWTGEAIAITYSQNYTYIDVLGSTDCVIVRTLDPLGSTPQTTLAVGVAAFIDFKVFSFGSFTYIFCGNKIIKSTTGTTTTSEVSLPLAATYNTCDVWQNRLWIATADFLFYTAPQNYDDFSNTATTGGTTRIPSCGTIYKLIGTKYGLYIFGQNGIFLQSGSSKNWQIDKISNLRLTDYSMVTSYNDMVIFADYSDINKKIWQLAATEITEICNIPSGYPTLPTAIPFSQLRIIGGGKYIALVHPTATKTSLVYSIDNKSFFETSEFNSVGETYFIKKSSTKYKIYQLPNFQKFFNDWNDSGGNYLTPLYPWAYKTAWITLDGNASNRKEISRIEFDYQGGTTDVYLYYAYGNGSSSSTYTVLNAPINSRLSTYVWNAPLGSQQSNRIYLYFLSNGAQTMTNNYMLKQIRIYYRNLGNVKTNTLR